MRNFFTIVLILINIFIYGKTFVSVSDGDWDNPAIWDLNDGTYPSQSDDVTINNTVYISDTEITKCQSLLISASGTLVLDDSYEFQLWHNSGTLSNSGLMKGPDLGGLGVFRPIYNLTLSSSGSYSNVKLRVTNSVVTVNSNISFSEMLFQSGAKIVVSPGKTLTIDGEVFFNSSSSEFLNKGEIIVNTNLFMTGTNGTSTILKSSIGDINCNVSSFPVPADYYKNVTISSNSTFSSDFSMTGNLIVNAEFNSSGSSTLTFSGSSSQSISGSSTMNFENILLNNSNGLTLSSGNINITGLMESISGTLSQNGATVILKSNSNNNAGMIKVSSSSDYSYSSGTFTTERYFNATSSGWRMVGAPIQNSTLNDWDDEFDYCGFTGSDYSYSGCGNFCSVWFYDETSAQVGNSSAGFDSATNITNSTTPDNGSIIYTGQGATTLSVTGTPEFRDRSFSVTKSGADAAFGYNLVSNPYPCTLDWTTFRADNTFLDNGYYIYQADAGNYLSVSGSGTIPHSQGFFVKKTSTGTSTLNLSTSQTVNTQANFTKSVNGINLPLTLKLTSNNNPYYDFAHVNTGSNYTNNYDPGEDIFELFSPYPDYVPNLFFLDNQGNKLDRTSINNNNSVDLLFDAKIGPFAHGTYTINFENLSQFMIGSCLTLEDLHNGIQTDLRLDSSYTFLSDSNATSPRFKLHIDVDYDIIVSNSTCFQDSSANISLQGNSIIGSFFNLIDSIGNLSDSVTATQDSLSFTNLNAGTYNILTNHIGRCNLQVQDIIIVEPQEVIANFQNINDTIFLDSSGSATIDFNNVSNGANYYIWNFGDGSISNLNSPTHSYNSSGIYIVSLEARSDSIGTCSSTYSKSINVINPFSTVDNNFEISKDFTFSVSDKYIELNFENNFEYEVGLQIFSIDNKLVYSKDDLNSLNKINLSNLNSGIYIITLLNQYSFETLYLKKFFLN